MQVSSNVENSCSRQTNRLHHLKKFETENHYSLLLCKSIFAATYSTWKRSSNIFVIYWMSKIRQLKNFGMHLGDSESKLEWYFEKVYYADMWSWRKEVHQRRLFILFTMGKPANSYRSLHEFNCNALTDSFLVMDKFKRLTNALKEKTVYRIL